MSRVIDEARRGTLPRVLIVGEAPNRRMSLEDRESDEALMIPRLLQMCGLPDGDFRSCFLRVNLLREWPGRDPSGEGDSFPRDLASREVPEVLRFLSARTFVDRVILCGKRVGACFFPSVTRPPPPWFTEGALTVDPLLRPVSVVVVPHPSGTSRWWNEEGNRRRAESFWAREAERALHLSACSKCWRAEAPSLLAFPCGRPTSRGRRFYDAYVAHASLTPDESHAWGLFGEDRCLCGWIFEDPLIS